MMVLSHSDDMVNDGNAMGLVFMIGFVLGAVAMSFIVFFGGMC